MKTTNQKGTDMANTNANIEKVLDRAVTVYNVWQVTESDTTYSEYYGIEEALALMLGIEQTEAAKMIREHRNKKEEMTDFFEF